AWRAVLREAPGDAEAESALRRLERGRSIAPEPMTSDGESEMSAHAQPQPVLTPTDVASAEPEPERAVEDDRAALQAEPRQANISDDEFASPAPEPVPASTAQRSPEFAPVASTAAPVPAATRDIDSRSSARDTSSFDLEGADADEAEGGLDALEAAIGNSGAVEE